ncbi:hypothetical protein [Streptomyces sp. DH37]|uniref:hypothetical protein n=1 Tax=Streptomyces sp. DH37 TaxID=3040122 RepID=UPI0024425EBE|nr:hypothetical protein [Streptomyces sp. DH37]MDG9703328.1 hypothetical protein [Streptomyces sp. DH37]
MADELDRPDAAMKADPEGRPKGPGHFPEPVAWIAAMREKTGDDRSHEHLKPHRDPLFGTRDRFDVRVRDHSDDYR